MGAPLLRRPVSPPRCQHRGWSAPEVIYITTHDGPAAPSPFFVSVGRWLGRRQAGRRQEGRCRRGSSSLSPLVGRSRSCSRPPRSYWPVALLGRMLPRERGPRSVSAYASGYAWLRRPAQPALRMHACGGGLARCAHRYPVLFFVGDPRRDWRAGRRERRAVALSGRSGAAVTLVLREWPSATVAHS